MSKIIGNTVGTPMNPQKFTNTTIIEIPKTVVGGLSVFPISKTGRYFVYAKFDRADTENNDIFNVLDIGWCDENMVAIETVRLQYDINNTDYVFLPIDVTRIPDRAAYLVSTGNEREIHLFEETVLADVLSETFENTDRRFQEIQSALGSYINDAYAVISEANALLGGDAE